jgi:nickel transport protein
MRAALVFIFALLMLAPAVALAHGVEEIRESMERPSHEGVFSAPESEVAEEARESGCSDDELEALVEMTLERKLKPMREEIRRLREAAGRPGLTEILGGIGYIMGLAGIAAYFKYRKGGK